jgi:hypothetical protein
MAIDFLLDERAKYPTLQSAIIAGLPHILMIHLVPEGVSDSVE